MICLVGFMGAGKSSALVELAAHGLSTADIDRLVETSEGLPVAEIFSSRGSTFLNSAQGFLCLVSCRILRIMTYRTRTGCRSKKHVFPASGLVMAGWELKSLQYTFPGYPTLRTLNHS